MSAYAEFEALLSRYFEGSASADEVVQLESLLLTDEQFADHASRWCIMHRQITELATEDALHEMMDRFVHGAPGPPRGVFATATEADDADAGASQNAAVKRRRRRAAWLAALAASVAALALGLTQWPRNEPQSPASDDHPLAPEPVVFANNGATPVGDAIIATLTRLSDAQWAPGAAPLHPGDQLSVGGRVALAAGMAKVTFECGAEVVLEGPCDFVIQSQMLGYLNSGKITADVPRRAFGFAILSPGVDFVDLGTSFGVDVGDDGRTELHVFEGEVLCSPTKPGGMGAASAPVAAGEAFHVQANRAVEFASSGGQPSDIAMSSESFSQLITLRKHAGVDVQSVIADRLALWLAADVAVATDGEGRVASWQDVIYGDNRSAEDAVQSAAEARPALVPQALNGRPAIRFDGESDFLLTTPLETTDDQTVLIVGQFAPSAFAPGRRWGGQILNYDGPPSRYLSNLLEPGVLQIGEPLLESQFKPTLLSAQVFAGFIGSATMEVGRVDGATMGAGAPFVLAYVYDYTHRRAELRINGQSFGEVRAYAPQGITSRKIIGRHAWMQNFFHGDLAELLIYNQALSPAELASTTKYLAKKYAIDLSAGD
jgi:hypothetical protein